MLSYMEGIVLSLWHYIVELVKKNSWPDGYIWKKDCAQPWQSMGILGKEFSSSETPCLTGDKSQAIIPKSLEHSRQPAYGDVSIYHRKDLSQLPDFRKFPTIILPHHHKMKMISICPSLTHIRREVLYRISTFISKLESCYCIGWGIPLRLEKGCSGGSSDGCEFAAVSTKCNRRNWLFMQEKNLIPFDFWTSENYSVPPHVGEKPALVWM